MIPVVPTEEEIEIIYTTSLPSSLGTVVIIQDKDLGLVQLTVSDKE